MAWPRFALRCFSLYVVLSFTRHKGGGDEPRRVIRSRLDIAAATQSQACLDFSEIGLVAMLIWAVGFGGHFSGGAFTYFAA